MRFLKWVAPTLLLASGCSATLHPGSKSPIIKQTTHREANEVVTKTEKADGSVTISSTTGEEIRSGNDAEKINLPLYAGSKLVGEPYESIGARGIVKTATYTCNDSPAKVVAFYQKVLGTSTRKDLYGGSVSLAGRIGIETITITIAPATGPNTASVTFISRRLVG